MDFEWCLQEVWPDWDNRNASRDVLKGKRFESPVLAWGIYLPQIRAFIKSAKVPRSQLLVLSFERLVTEPKVTLPLTLPLTLTNLTLNKLTLP